jgi:hypothetical protein
MGGATVPAKHINKPKGSLQSSSLLLPHCNAWGFQCTCQTHQKVSRNLAEFIRSPAPAPTPDVTPVLTPCADSCPTCDESPPQEGVVLIHTHKDAAALIHINQPLNACSTGTAAGQGEQLLHKALTHLTKLSHISHSSHTDLTRLSQVARACQFHCCNRHPSCLLQCAHVMLASSHWTARCGTVGCQLPGETPHMQPCCCRTSLPAIQLSNPVNTYTYLVFFDTLFFTCDLSDGPVHTYNTLCLTCNLAGDPVHACLEPTGVIACISPVLVEGCDLGRVHLHTQTTATAA